MKCTWHRVSAICVQAGFGSVAITNRKHDLSLWGQKNLANSLSLGIRRPGFSSQLVVYLPCALGQVTALLGLQNYNCYPAFAALGVCKRGTCDVTVGICRVLFIERTSGCLAHSPALR